MCQAPPGLSTDPGEGRSAGLLPATLEHVAALPKKTRALLAQQSGVIGLWQIDPPTRRQVQRLVRQGHAQRITWSTYLLACGETTREQRLWAAYLHCGPEAVIGGRTALTLSGWSDTGHESIHVLVPRTRHPRHNPDWLIVHRTGRFPTTSLGSLPRVDHHLAGVQAAGWAGSDGEVLYVLTSAMQQRIITAGRLQQTVTPSTHRRRLILDIAEDYSAGMQSMNERRFSQLCRQFGLPEPTRQTRRMDSAGMWRYTDAEFTMRDGRTLMVEIDGLHHLEPQNWLADIDRQNNLMLTVDGLLLRVATWTLKHAPDPFFDKLRPLL